MSDFEDLAEGARRLAALPAMQALHVEAVVAVVPNGVPAGLAVADVLGLPVLVAEREDAPVDAQASEEPRFRIRDPREPLPPRDSPDPLRSGTVRLPGSLVVADDGVETGTAALALGRHLRDGGVRRLVLAVPVCPRQAEPALRTLYDEVIAVVRPLARRSLHWHYAQFTPLDRADALGLLARRPSGGLPARG